MITKNLIGVNKVKIGKRGKRVLKVFICIVFILMIAVVINFIPTWNLKTKGMHKLEGDWITVYYETEEAAAKDVFELAENKAEELTKKLGFTDKQDVNIYIYDNQKTMQRKKYGVIAPMLGLDWYIGDNIGTNVILTSPANPGKVHNYDNNKYAVLHEMVHGYVSILNKKVQLWLTEGMALYLGNGEPFQRSYLASMKIPSYSDIQTKNPVRFSKMSGYTFAHTYIDYLEVTYGWEKVLEIIRTENYPKVLGKSEKEIYQEWVEYINN